MKLGTVQHDVLDSLHRYRGWCRGCGWLWDTDSNTTRIMESLVKRGMATKTTFAVLPSKPKKDMYKISRKGRAYLKAHRAPLQSTTNGAD